VHIAGTKGKGSTAAMIASILASSGYRTGLYTSPHLLSITERIKVNGHNIPEADFADIMGRMVHDAEQVNRSGGLGELTTFELLTALAFIYFKEAGVDYQVLETGLGGRLDATNVVKPEVCIITSISYDHTDVLGDTLQKIAFEKAGIIKGGSNVVCASQQAEAMDVISRVCREKGARLLTAGREFTWESEGFTGAGQTFTVHGLKQSYHLDIPLLGEYQLENAATAVAAVEALSDPAVGITPQSIAAGLHGLQWQGRLQVLRKNPLVVIDGAHNAYSMKLLGVALRRYFRFARLFMVFGASSDKDIDGMVAEIKSFADGVIFTGSGHPRAVPPPQLAILFSKAGKAAPSAGNVAAAMEMALARAGPNDLICATGSIFLIAEVMRWTGKQH
jgi:dihydrofolate synthase/folylpolyglutamate synthase